MEATFGSRVLSDSSQSSTKSISSRMQVEVPLGEGPPGVAASLMLASDLAGVLGTIDMVYYKYKQTNAQIWTAEVFHREFARAKRAECACRN